MKIGSVILSLVIVGIFLCSCAKGTSDSDTDRSRIGSIITLPDTGSRDSSSLVFGEDSDYEINSRSYTDNGHDTVTDNVTQLVWQKRASGRTLFWEEAVTYCEELRTGGYADWGLPNRIELLTIVDYGAADPSIDLIYFPNTKALFYWTSSTRSVNPALAWVVNFANGGAVNENKTSSLYGVHARCLRKPT